MRLFARPLPVALAVVAALLAPTPAADAGRKPKPVKDAGIDFGGVVREITFDGGFSANGRWAVGTAEVFTGNDLDTRGQVVLLDVRKRRMRLISKRAADGGPSTGDSFDAAISADGRRIVYASRSTDIATDGTVDENGQSDIFLHDIATGETRVLSKSAGTNRSGDDFTFSPAFSPDGRHVVFSGSATDLVTEGPAPAPIRRNDAFLHDLETGATTLISVNAAGTGGGDARTDVPIDAGRIRPFSADGRFLVFRSNASDLVEGVGDVQGGSADIFVRDLANGTTELISVTDAGQVFGIDQRFQPHAIGISGDGRYVTFSGRSPEITDPGFVNQSDVFVRDRQEGRTIVATRSAIDGGPSEGANFAQSMSADGRLIVFTTRDAELGFTDATESEGEDLLNVCLYDVEADEVLLVSHRHRDPQTTGRLGSRAGRISDDGRTVVFYSYADDLVRKSKKGEGTEVFRYDVRKRRAKQLTKFGKQLIRDELVADAHNVRLDPRGKTAILRFGRYSLVDDDFEDDNEQDLILRVR